MRVAMIIAGDLIDIAQKAADCYGKIITIFNGTMEAGITISKELKTNEYDVIISRGRIQQYLINMGIKIPIISIPITNLDIFDAVNEAEKIDTDITIMAYKDMIPAISSYEKITGKKLRVIDINNENEIKIKFKQLACENKKVVIGGASIKHYATLYNIKPILIKTSLETFSLVIEEAIRIAKVTRNEKESIERINAIVNNSRDGIMCINNKGTIVISNKKVEQMLKLAKKDLIWKQANDVLPELELDGNIENLREEIEIIKSIKGKKFIISKIPIKVKKEIMDVMIILKDIDEIYKLEKKIQQDIICSGHFAKYRFKDIIGKSSKLLDNIRTAKAYACVNSTVLIEGKTGTGKEVFAQSIHNYSDRAKRPFVAVNCAVIPHDLLESELFGYVPGAFTGADRKGKIGLFEAAQGGTIFLDEISEMDIVLQSRLLRVLQEKQIMRIGSNKLIPIDVRVIAASNKDILKLIGEGRFREDLYYRLNILKIVLSPIKDRKEDISCLLEYFIDKYCIDNGKEIIDLSDELMGYLFKYDWPGNVREIRNFAERVCVLAKSKEITLQDVKSQLPCQVLIDKSSSTNTEDFKLDVKESKMIDEAILKSNGNISKAADLLGISRTTMWRKMKKYNIVVSKK